MWAKEARIEEFDKALSIAMQEEMHRQETQIELIASENYASPRVLEAQGSVLTNKYAEGYPGRRYYGGCEYVDCVEDLAIERAKLLFKGAEYVNVQPHSGSQANAAVLMALLNPGDTLLGMDLAHGGHLTHGAKVSFSGKLYKSVTYGVNEQDVIDYDQVQKIAEECLPKLIIAGFSAYSRQVDWQRFRAIADKVGAYLMADIAHVSGLIVADLYPSPVNFADVVTTTTHKTLRGPRGGLILSRDAALLGKKMNSAIFPGSQGGPLMHVIAAKAVAFLEALQPEFKEYQKRVLNNAKKMAEVLSARQFKIVSGGTDNHLFLVDLRDQNISGKEAEAVLERATITLNKNMLPNDPRSPSITSGLRIGTPAVTTRGFDLAEVERVAHWIADILEKPKDEARIESIKQEVLKLCQQFPVYANS